MSTQVGLRFVATLIGGGFLAYAAAHTLAMLSRWALG
jgi:hypothetical protein